MYESENPTALQIARERHDNAMDAIDAVDSGDYVYPRIIAQMGARLNLMYSGSSTPSILIS